MTGGSGYDSGRSIELDSKNNAYIAGFTECSDFPLVNPLGSYVGGNEAFASLFDPTKFGSASLLDSTYIGGSNHDEGWGIGIDNNDDAYVTGLTYSTDFPTKNAFQGNRVRRGDAFVAKFFYILATPTPPPIPTESGNSKLFIFIIFMVVLFMAGIKSLFGS